MNKDSIFEESVLVASAKEGDSDAFGALASRYHGLLYSYISSLGVDESEREDLMQEALLGLLRAVRSYDSDRSSFATYVSACVKNSITSYLRRSGRQVRSFPVEDVYSVCENGDGESPELILIDMESTAQLMKKVFSVLSPYEKKVFEMYLAEIPYASIAKRLNKNEKSIDNAIQRIKAKLKKLV
ncbi:MAG: sigma-70 family RNA polymerase sigma factor [Clostridia bacterium]|nr:sigma-70 family RNA polymerase sigma factor [Clostridia bacterium]